MSSKIEHSWNGHVAELTFSANVAPNDSSVAALFLALEALHAVTPLESFTVTVAGANTTYAFEAQDGRVWSQVFHVSSSEPQTATTMNFNVPGFFRLDEFVPHRALRVVVIDLVASRGLTKIEVTWP